jgi:ribonuclease VapC
MARRARTYVLDSWAVLAYLDDENSGQKVADLITYAHENGIPLCMSVVNAGEVWYIIAREISEPEADKAVAELAHLGIELIDADWSLTRAAGTFKAHHKMSYADCFAAALAKDRKATFITGDKEFKQVEDEIGIYWV